MDQIDPTHNNRFSLAVEAHESVDATSGFETCLRLYFMLEQFFSTNTDEEWPQLHQIVAIKFFLSRAFFLLLLPSLPHPREKSILDFLAIEFAISLRSEWNNSEHNHQPPLVVWSINFCWNGFFSTDTDEQWPQLHQKVAIKFFLSRTFFLFLLPSLPHPDRGQSAFLTSWLSNL